MKKYNIKYSFIIFIITVLYGIISFINLGDLKVPQTFWHIENENDFVILEIEKNYVQRIRYYSGPRIGTYQLFISNDGIEYNYLKDMEQKNVFAWQDLEINAQIQYLKIVSTSTEAYLGDIALYDTNDNKINIKGSNQIVNLLTDEQSLVPKKISFMNSTYFDEIYYARTAYEYIHNLDIYEWTHPPLGKLIMTIPVILFGFSPFSYRLMGNIAGILMIPIIYIIAKDILKNKKYALLASIVLAFDNFHFVQTRIATIDSYLVLFIMLAYMFMNKYLILDDKAKMSKKLTMLFFSGLFMGCAISTKWTGCFAALGLAILFFGHLIKNNVIKNIKIKKNELNIKFNEQKWNKQSTTITLFCILFFVIIPVIIYCACYIPDINIHSLKEIMNLQVSMYDYHSKLSATHPFSSKWYTWFIMMKPVWYYTNNISSSLYSTISGIGNPLIWWTGLISMFYILIKGIKTLDKRCILLLIPIFTALIPYLGINRVMSMYHYFPVLPFMIISIAFFIKDIEEKVKFKKIYLIYILLIGLTFIYFYPVVSGMGVSKKYVESTQWLESWYY